MSTLLPVLTEYEKSHLSERQPLPEQYVGLSDTEMDTRIAAARAKLGKRLVILGHHYQRDEVIKFADVIGDSLKLAQHAARRILDFFYPLPNQGLLSSGFGVYQQFLPQTRNRQRADLRFDHEATKNDSIFLRGSYQFRDPQAITFEALLEVQTMPPCSPQNPLMAAAELMYVMGTTLVVPSARISSQHTSS